MRSSRSLNDSVGQQVTDCVSGAFFFSRRPVCRQNGFSARAVNTLAEGVRPNVLLIIQIYCFE
jgi:hypothetical protein